MAKLTNASMFKIPSSAKELPIDKTTRNVRKIVAGETERRQAKIARLRKSRLERGQLA